MPVPAPLAFPLFALLFPALWVVVTCLLSFGGWQQLATHYQVAAPPTEAKTHLLGYAKMGKVKYQNVLRAGVCRQGLVLTVWFLFRPMHPPLLIPWQAVDSIETTKSWWTTTYSVTLVTGDDADVVFQFTSSTLLAALRPWVCVLPLTS